MKIIVLLLLLSWGDQTSNSRDILPFSIDSTTVLKLRYSYQDSTRVVLRDSGRFLGLLNGLHFEEKQPCNCAHVEEALFVTPSGEHLVSLCDHCFTLVSERSGQAELFKMPAEFYRFFLAYQDSVQYRESIGDRGNE